MHCHSLIANATALHALTPMFPVPHRNEGPVIFEFVDSAVLAAANDAAAIWNAFLFTPKQRFNVSVAALPRNIVGQIWIPCGDVCNVTVDTSYNAVVNVLVHEFGHGLNLPQGSRSSQFPDLVVGEGNHWVPGTIDPREIMTASLDRDPYLSKYTLDAIAHRNHIGCHYDYDCAGTKSCRHYSNYYPGVCDDYTLYGESLFFGFVILLFIVPLIIAVSCIVTSDDHSHQYAFSAL